MQAIQEQEQPSRELSTDINVITADINAYKRVAGEVIFEIGRRLKHVKDNDLVHGEWERWCRHDLNMEPSEARKFIKVIEKLGSSNRCTYTDLGLRALYELTTFSLEQREQPHEIPSTGEVKTVNEMTVKELREVKKALKEAEARAEKAEQDYNIVQDTLESIQAQPPKVVPDPTLSERLVRYETKYGDIDGVVTECISNHIEVDGAAAHFADDVQTFLLRYAHLTTYRSTFTGITDTAYDEYRSSLDALCEFVSGMQRVLDGTPKGKAVVIDITQYKSNSK